MSRSNVLPDALRLLGGLGRGGAPVVRRGILVAGPDLGGVGLDP
jgi:hypothetical protein